MCGATLGLVQGLEYGFGSWQQVVNVLPGTSSYYRRHSINSTQECASHWSGSCARRLDKLKGLNRNKKSKKHICVAFSDDRKI